MSGLTMQGVIISKANKTINVEVTRSVMHPKYKKIVKKTKNYLAHNDSPNDLNVGDVVKIMSCKPISRKKRWVVV